MRGITFSFPTQTGNEITATQVTTASATLPLNGSLSNITQLNQPVNAAIPQASPGPGISRCILVYSSGNISTSTFTFTGFDIRGVAVSTSFAGPTGTAVPTKSTTEFAVVLTASCQTAATTNFTIGFGASGLTNWVRADQFVTPFALQCSANPATSAPITVQDTFQDPNSAAPTIIFTGPLSAVTVATQAAYTAPVSWVRGVCTATLAPATISATGVATVNFSQAGA